MSVYIEQNRYKNCSQGLFFCEKKPKFRFRQALKLVRFWIDRSRQRKHLATLDDRLLKDIGYSRSQVQKEISKPFWK